MLALKACTTTEQLQFPILEVVVLLLPIRRYLARSYLGKKKLILSQSLEDTRRLRSKQLKVRVEKTGDVFVGLSVCIIIAGETAPIKTQRARDIKQQALSFRVSFFV